MALGSYGNRSAQTPHLDALAERGVRFAEAITVSPLTLPAHASLLTGLTPPAHGVHDNGLAALPRDLPTLATEFARHGYQTAAVVASSVLDHRFGLARGFDLYEDRLLAERLGEYGYPERSASQVTDSALSWAANLEDDKPYFLWVHYYDPHSPYTPPGGSLQADTAERYAGEITYMDHEIGRLLQALPGSNQHRLVAAVADHGEMLGEHGEDRHGLLLYRASLRVPLLLAGPGIPRGTVETDTVASRRLAATLLRAAGFPYEAFGAPLPGASAVESSPPMDDIHVGKTTEAAYSETWLPATAYGWSPLKALTDQRWRLIVAPRPELYDLQEDPAETVNLLNSESTQERTRGRRAARRLSRLLKELESRWEARDGDAVDASDLTSTLRALGYLSGASGNRAGTLDPKDGLVLLAEFEDAKALLRQGRAQEGRRRLEDLVRRDPGNIPFLSRLAAAQRATGNPDTALQTLEKALDLHPASDRLYLQLARLHHAAGREAEARKAYRQALEISPRLSDAWLGLAEMATRRGRDEERALLEEAMSQGVLSAAILTRLAQLHREAERLDAADKLLETATRHLPSFAAAWWTWGQVAEDQGRLTLAVERFQRVVTLAPTDPSARLYLARLRIQQGQHAVARRELETLRQKFPNSPQARQAVALLDDLPPP